MPATGVSGCVSGPVGPLGRAGRRAVSGLGLDTVSAARRHGTGLGLLGVGHVAAVRGMRPLKAVGGRNAHGSPAVGLIRGSLREIGRAHV